jgi:hypothetical protein
MKFNHFPIFGWNSANLKRAYEYRTSQHDTPRLSIDLSTDAVGKYENKNNDPK